MCVWIAPVVVSPLMGGGAQTHSRLSGNRADDKLLAGALTDRLTTGVGLVSHLMHRLVHSAALSSRHLRRVAYHGQIRTGRTWAVDRANGKGKEEKFSFPTTRTPYTTSGGDSDVQCTDLSVGHILLFRPLFFFVGLNLS
ncbi:hypothetical protein AAHC03_0150 [Spirometra sp. Aus1]